MKRIAVIGGGPAGAMAAAGLARGGFKVLLVDEKLAWEKPCGGGVTQKAYQQYPFLKATSDPHTATTLHAAIQDCELQADGGKPCAVHLRHPVLVYSRRDLNQQLLDRAELAGAQIEKVRVTAAELAASGWRLRTKGAAIEADSLVIATGARNPLRQFGTEWDSANSMLAIGYYLPIRTQKITIRYFTWLQGYLWLFPRGDHVSAGICGKGATQAQMRAQLERYLDEQNIPWKGSPFYAHLIPALETTHWQQNRVSGDGWLATGDAAGLVDPLTGEGIYYAMRSGELAAQALLAEGDVTTRYQESLRDDFVGELELAAKLARVFYLGETGLGTVPQRMIQFARHNSKIRQLLQELVSGTQNYSGLRNRVSDSLQGRVLEQMLKYLRASYHRLEVVAQTGSRGSHGSAASE